MKRDYETPFIVVICSVIGIVLSQIIRTLYNAGVVLDEFITDSITITDVMLVVVILWFIIGVIISILRR